MSHENEMVDALVTTVLRKDAPPEVKENSLDLLRKLSADGSRAARSVLLRLKFDTERRRWTLRSATEIRENPNGHRPLNRQG